MSFQNFQNPFADLFKNSVDLNQVFATQRRNIETLTAANQAMVESAQAIARRQAEVLREGVENCLKASREIFTSGTPEAGLSKQAEVAREIFQNAIENAREVTEMTTKSCFEVFDVLNKRASESLDEIGKASSKKKAAA